MKSKIIRINNQLGNILSVDVNHHVSKEQKENSNKYLKRNLHGMLKYFALHTGLHGIKYTLDKKLYKIERILWALMWIVGLCFCSKIILELYEKFQTEYTRIRIDKINLEGGEIAFPSVTFCPGTMVDWNNTIKAVDDLRNSNLIRENDTSTLLNIIKEISKLRFSRLDQLKIDFDNSTMNSFKDVDLSDLLNKSRPNCDHMFRNCSWNYEKVNCCDIFESQKTILGFCYAFNSLTSANRKSKTIEDLFNTSSYGIRSGLEFSVKYDDVHFPPDSEENDTAYFMVAPPDMFPSKIRKVKLGNSKYNVNVKFMCATASPGILRQEDTTDKNILRVCKYDNNTYNYKRCLDTCEQTTIVSNCNCNPSFMYPKLVDHRDCKIEDLECMIKHGNSPEKECNCPKDCKYCYYDDEVAGFDQDETAITVDVHYDGPTGILYQTELVVSDLDLLVQLGSVFGLFLGGSLVTVTEFLCYCLIGTVCSIYQIFIKLKSRNKKNITRSNGLLVINVMQYSANGNRHIVDFSIKMNN